MKHTLLSILVLSVLWSCAPTKTLQNTDSVTVETRQLDTLVISANDEVRLEQTKTDSLPNQLPVYHPSYEREIDLIHTTLHIKFDFEKEAVLGKAILRAKPWFYPINRFTLDAKGFEIHSVKLKNRKELSYDYQDDQLTILLDKNYTREQNIEVEINYTAYPGKGPEGGSQAIASSRGLFFINPRGEDPDKPTQIWTQGETEHNSRWFPTIDKPIERCTQEMYITVDDKYTTLSNGLMLSSVKNPDGTRTDYWKMDKPHAPYLFMIAVGEYAVVKDHWRGIELGYYVEPEYEKDAKKIFEYTPEMLDFFSELLGVKYPWSKYSQIVVRDYVSGAMENTTAVIFGEFVQKHERELIDRSNERIVAHEMFHHWFGDLVTCESWSNLTLNEGFATYSEYLWFEHKHGRDAADHHRMNQHHSYLASTMQGGIHPLIYFGYGEKEEMFDAHSYNKGGLVLHQLRDVLGKEAFFAGLKKYLNDNAYTDVEAHELRLAMEEVSGRDLNWFFDQWFFSAGHPTVVVTKEFNPETRQLNIKMEQTQPASDGQPHIFQLPIAIDIYVEGMPVRRETVLLNQRKQEWTFDLDQNPALVNVDANRVFIGNLIYDQSDAEYAYMYDHAPLFEDRNEAIQKLSKSPDPVAQTSLKKALKDPFWAIRKAALMAIQLDEKTTPVLLELTTKDPHSDVRKAAISKLSEHRALSSNLAESIIKTDRAYPVVAEALLSLMTQDSLKALQYAKEFDRQNIPAYHSAVANIYAATGSKDFVPFFRKAVKAKGGFEMFSFAPVLVNFLGKLDDTTLAEEINFIHQSTTKAHMWKKLALFKTLFDIKNGLDDREPNDTILTQVNRAIDEIYNSETNQRLKGIYDQFLNRS